MTQDEFEKLERGDIVQSASGEGYVVTEGFCNGCVQAVRSVTMTNPGEWKKIAESVRLNDRESK